MGRAFVIKKLKVKGLLPIELLSHGYMRIDGAMITYDRWKKAFEQLAKPFDIDIKKKRQYFAAMDKLRKFYMEWLQDPEKAEKKFKAAEVKAKKAAAAKKIADEKAASQPPPHGTGGKPEAATVSQPPPHGTGG